MTDAHTEAGGEALLTAWDEMDRAAQCVLTALPARMTEAAIELDRARLSMRAAVQSAAFASPRTKPEGA